MRLNRVVAAALSVAVVAGTTLLAAPSASADQVWYQGVERASVDAPCPTSSSDELRAGWSEWTASWAQWANGGKGGYVCTRAITWAHEDAGGDDRICVLVDTEGDQSIYVLLPGWSVREGTEIGVYFNASCTDRAEEDGIPFTIPVPFDVVWAPDGESQAETRCHIAFGSDYSPFRPEPDPENEDDGGVPPGIWLCVPD